MFLYLQAQLARQEQQLQAQAREVHMLQATLKRQAEQQKPAHEPESSALAAGRLKLQVADLQREFRETLQQLEDAQVGLQQLAEGATLQLSTHSTQLGTHSLQGSGNVAFDSLGGGNTVHCSLSPASLLCSPCQAYLLNCMLCAVLCTGSLVSLPVCLPSLWPLCKLVTTLGAGRSQTG